MKYAQRPLYKWICFRKSRTSQQLRQQRAQPQPQPQHHTIITKLEYRAVASPFDIECYHFAFIIDKCWPITNTYKYRARDDKAAAHIARDDCKVSYAMFVSPSCAPAQIFARGAEARHCGCGAR